MVSTSTAPLANDVAPTHSPVLVSGLSLVPGWSLEFKNASGSVQYSPWDIAAGLLILQEAGGVATRLDGSAIDLENGSVLAANGEALRLELASHLIG